MGGVSDFVSIQLKRSRLIISCPEQACSLLARLDVTSAVAVAKTGRFPRRANGTSWRMGHRRIALAADRLGCRSVAFTYNDPVIFAEYAIDVAEACRERGIKVVAVTAGYITEEARPEFYRHMDAANVDLKAFADTFYHRLCFAQLDPVLDTLKYLRHETNVWFEVTTLLIPGEK